MEVINSHLNAYGKLIDSQSPLFHEFSKIKVFDYEAIFMTLEKADDPKIQPRFEDVPLKLPAVKYIYDPTGKLSCLIWSWSAILFLWMKQIWHDEYFGIGQLSDTILLIYECARGCAQVRADIFKIIFISAARSCAQNILFSARSVCAGCAQLLCVRAASFY